MISELDDLVAQIGQKAEDLRTQTNRPDYLDKMIAYLMDQREREIERGKGNGTT